MNPNPVWLSDPPVIVRVGPHGARALIVSLTEEGLSHAVIAGAADIQATALGAAGIGPDPGCLLTWRYTATRPEQLPREAADMDSLDRLLGRHERSEPLLVARRQSAGSIRQVLHIPADLAWFDGHFPDEPVLAGVVQLKWAVEAAKTFRGPAAQPRAIQQLKFKSPIRPESIVELAVMTADHGATVTFLYRSSAGEHSSARLAFGPG